MLFMCWKHIRLGNDIVIHSGTSRAGKTYSQALFILECEDIPEDFILPNWISQWAGYLDNKKRVPLTKLDLRQIIGR